MVQRISTRRSPKIGQNKFWVEISSGTTATKYRPHEYQRLGIEWLSVPARAVERVAMHYKLSLDKLNAVSRSHDEKVLHRREPCGWGLPGTLTAGSKNNRSG